MDSTNTGSSQGEAPLSFDSPAVLSYHLTVGAAIETKGDLVILISREEIERRVKELGAQISRDYRGRRPLMVGVLKGAFVFLSDLLRAMDIPSEVDFVRVASYGSGTASSGKIRLVHRLQASVKGKDVIIVEDIVDSGHTSAWLRGYLLKKGPASVKLCALLDKVERHEVPVEVDYRGFQVTNKFVVGYGTDFDEDYRHLPEVHVMEDESLV